jgi:hypothetical protein
LVRESAVPLRLNLRDLSIAGVLFSAGFLLVYLQNLRFGANHPIGWDTAGYVSALNGFIANPVASVANAPFRVGYTMVEFAVSRALGLNAFQAEAYFPVILAGFLPPMFYVLTTLYAGSRTAGILASLFGIVWFEMLRIPRDLHSNLFWLLLVTMTLSFLAAAQKTDDGRTRRYLIAVVVFLMVFSFIEYPVEIIIFLVLLLSAYALFVQSHFFGGVNRQVLRTSARRFAMLVVYPVLLLASFWGLGDLASHGALLTTILGFISSGTTLQPLQGAGTQVLQPASQYFIMTFPWLGPYGFRLDNLAVGAVLMSLLTYAGVIFTARNALKGDVQVRAMSWVLLIWYSVSVIAIFSTSLGIFYPFDRAEMNIVDPVFTALGLWGIVRLLSRSNLGNFFSVGVNNKTITVSMVCFLIGFGVFAEALPYRVQYASDVNTFFSTEVSQDMNAVLAWQSHVGSSRIPIFLIDYGHATPDYLILYENVISAYFANKPTQPPLFYYGSLNYLLLMTSTPSDSYSQAESSAFTAAQILNETAGNLSDFDVFVVGAFYDVGTLGTGMVTQISPDAYVLNKQISPQVVYGGPVALGDFHTSVGWYGVNDGEAYQGFADEATSNGQVLSTNASDPQRTYAQYLASNYVYRLSVGYYDYAANNAPLDINVDGANVAVIHETGTNQVLNFSTTFRPQFSGLHNLTLTFGQTGHPYIARVLWIYLEPETGNSTNACSSLMPVELVSTTSAYFGAEGEIGTGQLVRPGMNNTLHVSFQWVGASSISVTRIEFGDYFVQGPDASTQVLPYSFIANVNRLPMTISSQSAVSGSGSVEIWAGISLERGNTLSPGQYDVPVSIWFTSNQGCGTSMTEGFLRVSVGSAGEASISPNLIIFSSVTSFFILSFVILFFRERRPIPSSNRAPAIGQPRGNESKLAE